MNEAKTIFPINLLRLFCPPHLLEEIEGDLLQKFERDVKVFGDRKAKRKLFWNVIRFCRPDILLRTHLSYNNTFMISNYFKVASRVMLRSKSFSAINISGLAFGITAFLLLFTWVKHEFSYDDFHVDKERIFKAWNKETVKGQISCWDYTPRVLAPTLAQEYSGVETAVSYAQYGSSHLFTVGQTKLVNTNGIYTDPAFLTLFSFPMFRGNPATALSNPNSIVLTEKFAKQLFGDKEAFGNEITIGELSYTFPFTVTGILKDLPSNTDFHFDYLISFQFLESIGRKDDNWLDNSVSTYVKLGSGVNPEGFNKSVSNIRKRHTSDSTVAIFLHPLAKSHLYSGFENGVQSGGRIVIVRMLGLLGICLLAIACINFINLSTARAQKRSKEVGIRKVTGANRWSLIGQFICESVLIALCAGIISLVAAYLALPMFNQLIHQQLAINFMDLDFWMMFMLFILVVGIIAGCYPAFYLSSFNPAKVLKGATIMTNRNFLRKTLVVFQFGFASMMIVSIIVIAKQINYVQNRDAGYNKNNLIYQTITGDLEKNYVAYKNELLSRGIAVSITKTSAPITEQWSGTDAMKWNGKDPQNKTNIERIYADDNISSTIGVQIIKGRDFDLQKFPSDSSAALINEAALKLMAFREPIGEKIDDHMEYKIVGVVKDFILMSPHQRITPIVIFGGKKKWFYTIHSKLNPQHSTQENISNIASLWQKYNSTYPLEYHFVDEEYGRKFADMQTTLKITFLFGFIAIFISCLGLLGLSTYMIESRVKEIGIRKVLGSSVAGIVKLLSKDSLKPILLAIILFSPFAWFSMNTWLQSFDYRISFHVGYIAVAGISILFMAWLTISIQTVLAARQNPTESLKTE